MVITILSRIFRFYCFYWCFTVVGYQKKIKIYAKKSLIGGLLAIIMFFIGALISPTDKSESSVETAKTEQTSSKKEDFF